MFESQSWRKSSKKKRKNVSAVIGGKALEGKTVDALKTYETETGQSKKCKTVNSEQISKCKKKNDKIQYARKGKSTNNKHTSPKPGPSSIFVPESISDTETEYDSEPIGQNETTVYATAIYVPKDKLDGSLFIVNWAGCDYVTTGSIWNIVPAWE